MSLRNVSPGYTYKNYGADFDTSKLLGKYAPDDGNVKYIGKVKVPLGKTFNKKSSMELNYDYNQYIVWNIERINIKFLIHYKIN